MRLVILDTSASVGDWAARYVMKRIRDFNPGPKNYFVLGLPTGMCAGFESFIGGRKAKKCFRCILGSTPLAMYKRLIQFHKEGKISFKFVKTFNMDEYVNLPRDHPESYHFYMWNEFFKHIDIEPRNVHILGKLLSKTS